MRAVVSGGQSDEPLSELVKRLREGRFTQRELAIAAGVSDGLIGNVERGVRNLGEQSANAIADALELGPKDRKALHAARQAYSESGTGRPNLDARLNAVEGELAYVRQAVDEILRRLGPGDDPR